jgi:hypothetical protein
MRTRVAALADQSRTVGEYTSAVFDVPAGATRLGIAIARKAWADRGRNESVQAFVSVSEDGVVWQELGGVGSAAGEVLARDGTPITETTCLIRLPRQRTVTHARVRVRYLGTCEGLVELVLDDEPVAPRALGEHRSVTYDNDADNVATAATSITISGLAVGNNANRYMIVGVGTWDATAADTVVSAVTFNGSGTGWGQITSRISGDNNRASLWGKTAPDVATASVVVTLAGTCAEIGANALSAYGVDQTTPTGAPAGADGSASAATVNVTAAADDLVYDCVYCNVGSAPTVGASQTQRMNMVVVTGSRILTSTEPGATTVTMSWTGTLDFWTHTAVALKAAAGAAAFAADEGGVAFQRISTSRLIAPGRG